MASHEARCTVCRSPYRAAIEEEFIHWHSLYETAQYYGIERRSIYRHAHALDLFSARDRNLRFALGHIIDEAERCIDVGASEVVRAVHAYARVTTEGQWLEPPAHIIVSSGSRPAPLRTPNQAFPVERSPSSPRRRKMRQISPKIPPPHASLSDERKASQMIENDHHHTTRRVTKLRTTQTPFLASLATPLPAPSAFRVGPAGCPILAVFARVGEQFVLAP